MPTTSSIAGATATSQKGPDGAEVVPGSGKPLDPPAAGGGRLRDGGGDVQDWRLFEAQPDSDQDAALLRRDRAAAPGARHATGRVSLLSRGAFRAPQSHPCPERSELFASRDSIPGLRSRAARAAPRDSAAQARRNEAPRAPGE